MKRMTLKNKAIAAVATAGVVAAAGTAWALWTANGSGTAQSKALTAQGVTVNAATATAELYPGGAASVYFTLTNPNPYPVNFTTMTPGAIVSSDPTNCAASNVTAAGKTGLNVAVAANSTSATLSIPAVVTMLTTALDGCQGVSFTVPLTLTGSQA